MAGRPDTPAPVVCEYCGAERHTKGFAISNRIFWFPGGAEPCTCPDGAAAYKRRQDEATAKAAAEEKAKADAEMRQRVQRITGESGLGERFLQRTFKTYVADTPERKKIATAALGYAKDFDRHMPKRGEALPGRNGYLISGTKGTGKTHIAAAIANYLLSRGTAVICMTERNLFDNIRRTYNRGKADGISESEVRRIYETVPLLIIDDLGKEKPTEWTLATLYAIIDGRYDRAMPLIITTNYDPRNLIARLTPTEGDRALSGVTADAIVDRLNEMCESIITTGESWRTRREV